MPFAISEHVRAAVERHHARQCPRLFVDNFPWGDPEFTRRFTVLTDVEGCYWGPAAPDVDRVQALLAGGDSTEPHVIDLCCGAGRHVHELAARGVRSTGIDISPYAIRRARARARAAAIQPARPGIARFIQSDVLSPPDTDAADVVAILCEQIVNFSPAKAAELISLWSRRIVAGGAMIVESATTLPPDSEDLYWMEQPLFVDAPCWVRHTQTADPVARTLLEVFTCLDEPGAEPRSFYNSRKYYTPREIARLAPASDIQIIDIPARAPRPELVWIVLRPRC
jgi:SAM-dependent methyltransferase